MRDLGAALALAFLLLGVLALSLFAQDPAQPAVLAVAALPLLLVGGPLRAAEPLAAAASMALFPRLCVLFGGPGPLSACALGGAAVSLLLALSAPRRRARRDRPTPLVSVLALLSLLAALLTVRRALALALPLVGNDVAARALALAPLLAASSLGLAAGRFLADHHPRRRPALVLLCALAGLVLVALDPADAAHAADAARRFQAPSVTRTHYLAGVALLTAALVGWPCAAFSAAYGLAKPGRRATLSCLVLALLAPRSTPPPGIPPARLDPVRSDLGGPRPDPPPGWPFPSEAAIRSRLAPDFLLTRAETFARFARESERVDASIDLGEVAYEDLLRYVRLLADAAPRVRFYLGGRHLHAVTGGPEAWGRAAEAGLVPLLSSEAARRLGRRARGSWRLVRLRSGRVRLVPSLPERAARHIQRLLEVADLLPLPLTAPHDDPAYIGRLRVRLAQAILDDRGDEEDRLLDLLARVDPDAEDLRASRLGARRRLLDRLFAERTRDPWNADVRWRLGRLHLAAGRTMAALDELTRAVELRPNFAAAVLDLERSLVRAASEGLSKPTPAGPVPPQDLFAGVERHFAFVAREPRARARRLAARARLALSTGDRATALTASAHAVRLAPRFRPALLARLLTLAEVAPGPGGPAEEALSLSRRATRIHPLEAVFWDLRASREPPAASRLCRARALALLGPAASPDASRTR